MIGAPYQIDEAWLFLDMSYAMSYVLHLRRSPRILSTLTIIKMGSINFQTVWRHSRSRSLSFSPPSPSLFLFLWGAPHTHSHTPILSSRSEVYILIMPVCGFVPHLIVYIVRVGFLCKIYDLFGALDVSLV